MKEFTKKLLSVPTVAVLAAVIVTMLATNPLGWFSPSVDAQNVRPAFRDHSLFFTGSSPADEAIFCGVQIGKGYTLHVSGTASGTPGSFIINFRDGDAMGFEVPAGSTYSTTHDLGGVPFVDDIVRITRTGGVNSMMVSVQVSQGAVDPFDETLDFAPAEKDNFCTRSVVGGSAGSGESGNTSAKAIFPAP